MLIKSKILVVITGC